MTHAKGVSVEAQCQLAKAAWPGLSIQTTAVKNVALSLMAKFLVEFEADILAANAKDLEVGRKAGLSAALLDRLALNSDRVAAMAEGCQIVEALRDPIFEVISGWQMPNGLSVSKVRVPIGVIGMIYEARPNVTVDAAALCIKSGNCVVLRGSSTAYHSNLAIAALLREALAKSGISPEVIQLLADTSRDGVTKFIQLSNYLDLVIPRGGADLISHVVKHSKVPTIETGVGNCHIYVDSHADLSMAIPIILNAKVQRPSVCNACETVLVHREIAAGFLPRLAESLHAKGVEIRGCAETCKILPSVKKATEEDWKTEYLELILAVRVVDDVDTAIAHIREYGTRHSEAILTTDLPTAWRFKREVDAAAVLVNTSTRFVDGGEFGFGAEIGISTQKMHARGPMGLAELTTTQYWVEGSGQVLG